MKLIRNAVLASFGALALSSCHAFHDDLPECPKPMAEIKFTYTQNMDFEDQFKESVHCLDLYIFKVLDGTKAEGATTSLVKTYHNENRMADGTVSQTMELEPGNYQAVVYGGMNCSQSSFAFKNLFSENPSVSVEDLEVALQSQFYFDETDETGDPEEDGIDHSALELHNHFYGTGNFTVTDMQTTPVVIDMMRNTNTINLYIVDKDAYDLEAHDYRMYIIDDNNEMGPDNLLIDSDDIVYRPYIKENTNVTYNNKNYPGIQTSFTVSKLSTRRSPKIAIINKSIGNEKPMLYTDLLPLLLAIKEKDPVGKTLDTQDYLNRENEWTITCEIDVAKNTWVSITIKVKDWEVRYDNASL